MAAQTKEITTTFTDPLGMQVEIDKHKTQAMAALGKNAVMLGTTTQSMNDKNTQKVLGYTVTSKWTSGA